jgi:hypothetical protein
MAFFDAIRPILMTWIAFIAGIIPVCTENLIRVDDVTESPKLAE